MSFYSPEQYAKCEHVLQTSHGPHGLAYPQWIKSQRSNDVMSPVFLRKYFGENVGERGGNAPSREEQFQPLIIEHRPILNFPHPIDTQSNAVPMVYDSQVLQSRGFDIGYDQIWVNNDYVTNCTIRK
jgi:hypothetical protein